MGLQERLDELKRDVVRTGVTSHLNEAHAHILAREDLFKLIRQTDPAQRQKVLDSVKGALPTSLIKVLEDGLSESSLKQRIKSESRKLSTIYIDVPFQTSTESSTSPWTAKILLPLSHAQCTDVGDSLESSIYQAICKDSLAQVQKFCDASVKPVGGYAILTFEYQSIRGGLISKLKAPSLPDSLKLDIGFCEIDAFDLFEQKRVYVQASPASASKIISIKLTSSALEYGILPARKEYDEFFPGFGIEFTLVAGNGEYTLKRTSRRNHSTKQGNYFTGDLKRLYRSYDATPDSVLVIRELEKNKRYFLDSVTHPPQH